MPKNKTEKCYQDDCALGFFFFFFILKGILVMGSLRCDNQRRKKEGEKILINTCHWKVWQPHGSSYLTASDSGAVSY